MTPLYIIDNSNFCYRFKSVHKYAKIEVNNIKIDTSVLVGYYKALKSNMFNDIVIVLDGFPQESYNLLPSYKGQRHHDESEDLSVPKLDVLKFLTKVGTILHKNIRVVCAPLQEADQVASSLTHLITNNTPPRFSFINKLNQKSIESDRMLSYIKGYQSSPFDYSQYDSVILGSTDADWLQLLRYKNVYTDDSTTGKNVTDSKSADSVSQVTPLAIPVYKTLFGDDADNIPKLDIRLNKQVVLNYINNWVQSTEQLKQFSQCYLLNQDNPEWLKPIVSWINQSLKNQQEFERNWAITYLGCYSVPQELQFPDYNIEETISKYRLRL